ncbi:MAG: membrane dipeptidase [Alphaproteobacteria bacterium]
MTNSVRDRVSSVVIDCLQYCNWSEEIFSQLQAGGVHAIHVTVAYHEDFRQTVDNLAAWNEWFAKYPQYILPGRSADDVVEAQASGRTAVFFGLQNCTPIEDDLGLISILHNLGIRFMQLSYNHVGPLATGWVDEEKDEGVTELGRAAIAEMNRVGLVIDMSHSAERSTLEAIDLSSRPIAISHANPKSWCGTGRNKSDAVLTALAARGGMLGFSLYPRHLEGGSNCALEDFCAMVARTADLIGPEHLGIGSDLCQDQPDAVVRWMRTGKWADDEDPNGDPNADGAIRFPEQPSWFRSNLDMPGIADALRKTGFSEGEVSGIMGMNWLRFFRSSFEPAASGLGASDGAPALSDPHTAA